VQDAAESLGSTYRGAPAAARALSLPSRSTGTRSSRRAAAGCSSRDDGWVEHARKLSTQAREPVAHYEHLEVGFNYRLSNLLAALGRAQLETLPDRVAARRRIRDRYRELLGCRASRSCRRRPTGRRNAWLTCIVVDPEAFGADRETVRLVLEAEDIESAAALEADAPSAGLRVERLVRRRRLGPPLSSGGSASRAVVAHGTRIRTGGRGRCCRSG
jgi:dTDP-4-amino-4,6-dideoxygalactose transaminase